MEIYWSVLDMSNDWGLCLDPSPNLSAERKNQLRAIRDIGAAKMAASSLPYHNDEHLAAMWAYLTATEEPYDALTDWAIQFHDVIYDALPDKELRSAEFFLDAAGRRERGACQVAAGGWGFSTRADPRQQARSGCAGVAWRGRMARAHDGTGAASEARGEPGVLFFLAALALAFFDLRGWRGGESG